MHLNYRRAAIAAGAGFAALLFISISFAIVLAISYGFAAKNLFGGGPRYDEILALTILPAASGAGVVLITLVLSNERGRALISFAIGFTLSFMVILRILEETSYSPGSDERTIAFTLALIATLSVLIAIVRRPDMGLRKVVPLAVTLIAFVIVLGAISVTVPDTSIYTSIAMAFTGWIVPPAFAGLFVNRNREYET